jgi:hypothetical protein
VTRNSRSRKWTVEKLAAGYDFIDVQRLHRRGMLSDHWVTFTPMLGSPSIVKIRAARYAVVLELRDRVDPQQIRVS